MLLFYFLVKITIFYIFLYAFLAGFFAALLHIFYSTLDERKPTYYGEDSLTLNNPGKPKILIILVNF